MKNPIIKKLVFLFFIFLGVHFPLLFANSGNFKFFGISEKVITNSESHLVTYNRIGLQAAGLSQKAFELAITGFEKLRRLGKIQNSHIITIADFSKSSTRKRLFVIDLDKNKLLFNTYVAHGQGSGDEFARKFSNIPESLKSSPGFYCTETTYEGKHGYSLKLEGLEPGINDNAGERAIVIHGADYVSERFIHRHGFLGRSWGCPAVPQSLKKPIINTIKGGSMLFIYSENMAYLQKTRILRA